MFIWLKAKLAIILIGLVATTTVVGTASVVAAKNHMGPLASTSLFSSVDNDHHGSTGSTQQDNNGTSDGNSTDTQQLVGVIRSADLTATSLVVIPDGQTVSVTISFDATTKVEQEHGALVAGTRARIEVTLLVDQTLYATEIQTLGPTTGQDAGQEDQKLLGTVQSVDPSAKTFVLLADGQSAMITIAFDAQTKIELEGSGSKGPNTLTQGARVFVEVIQRVGK